MNGESWGPPPAALPAPLQEVHLWRVPLDAVAGSRAHLSPDEQARADKFVHFQLRDRFVAMRAALRSVLAGYLQIPPDSLIFAYGDKGKPSLVREQNSLDLRFNLSHSGGLGLLAATCGSELGVDVETRQEVVDFMAIAKRFFSVREYGALLELPAQSRQKGFLRCWTRKESYVKATGRGLACSLRSFSVSVSPETTTDALLETEYANVHHIRDVSLPDECFAALTVEGEDRRRSCFTYKS